MQPKQALETFLQNAVMERQIAVDHVKTVLEKLEIDGIAKPLPKIKFKNNTIDMYWENKDYFLEISIHRLKQIDWFYRNKSTGEVDGTDFGLDSEITPELLKRFRNLFP